jgi:hypothetical protein
MKKKSVIEFYPVDEHSIKYSDAPQPSVHSNIPEWFKNKDKYIYGNRFMSNNGETNLSIRSCIPFLESLTAGYTVSLYCDIQVRIENGEHVISWNGKSFPSPLSQRPNNEINGPSFPKVDGYGIAKFSWNPSWCVKTSSGYSSYFIHPLNRIDLPFYTLGGVMDTDKWGDAGNHPFLIKDGWEGIIEKGTPIIQVIPFKRDTWTSKISINKINEYRNKLILRDKTIKGWYKKNAWSNKIYR